MPSRGESAIRFRPHLWQAALSWLMSLFFGGIWVFGMELNTAVDMACSREALHIACTVTTHSWPKASVLTLPSGDVSFPALEIVAEPHDRSFLRVELDGQFTRRELTDFTPDVQSDAVYALNEFLDARTDGAISRRLVEPHPSLNEAIGLWAMLLMGILTFTLGVYGVGQVVTFSVIGGGLEVRHWRWPFATQTKRFEAFELDRIAAVSRITPELEPFVASLPWRNIYRATALVVYTPQGAEVPITPWCKRGRAAHERVAVRLRDALNRRSSGDSARPNARFAR